MGRPTRLFANTPLKKRRLKTNKQVTADYWRARDRFLFGSLGAASPVRRIDPGAGKVVAIVKPVPESPKK
jgi:hypothetical protein